MKKIAKLFVIPAASLFAFTALQGCSDENTFMEGEGQLRMRMVLNSELTRADEAEGEADDIASTARIYILDSKGGILHKYEGLADVPNTIPLRYGKYTAEAYAGKQVPASYDDKYYVARTEFEIDKASTNVVLECKIENVAAQVSAESIQKLDGKLKDWKFTIGHSNGVLDFTEENVAATGYYTLPADDTDLVYTVTGKNADDVAFTKTGVIKDVLPNHLYELNVVANDKTEDVVGGAFIDIIVNDIDESKIKNETIVIYSRPDVAGSDFDLGKQQYAQVGSFTDKAIRIRSFGDLQALRVETEDGTDFYESTNSIDLMIASPQKEAALKDAGLYWTGATSKDDDPETAVGHLIFKDKFLNSLPTHDKEYRFRITATDKNNKTRVAVLRIANTEAAIVYDDPVVLTPIDQAKDLMAVSATSATVTGSITGDATNIVVQYREVGTTEWQSVPAQTTRASVTFTAKLTNLKPGATYEYRVAADGFESSDIFTLQTEEKYLIPNASFEEWSTYSVKVLFSTKNVVFPGSGSERYYWDSGNEGSATVNMVLTDKSSNMIHSGTYAARLESKSAAGVIAAGNIFAGTYVRTDGTNGVLSLGREYNGSHPTAVQVYANYRPGTDVSVKSGNESYVGSLKAGGNDHGQIYVALTTGPVEIRTNPDNRKLFNPEDPEVIAYGQVTWTEAFGPDGQLQLLTIPLTYNAKAKTVKPTHLVITAAASKFGDYFSGSVGSTIYLDDFELVY